MSRSSERLIQMAT